MISMQVGRKFLVVLTIKQDVKSSSLVDKTIHFPTMVCCLGEQSLDFQHLETISINSHQLPHSSFVSW
jgi:hypothetical protein